MYICINCIMIVQVLSDDVYHGSVEDELATECGRNKPNILKLQRYCMAGNFCQEKFSPILPPTLIGENIVCELC